MKLLAYILSTVAVVIYVLPLVHSQSCEKSCEKITIETRDTCKEIVVRIPQIEIPNQCAGNSTQSESNNCSIGCDELAKLSGRIQELETKLAQLDAQFAELINAVTDLKVNAITNLRLGDIEGATVWNGPGYRDSYGYVITGASNFNEDPFIDSLERRKIEKFVNGAWIPI